MNLKNQTVILKNILYCDHYSVKYKVDNQEEINKKLEEGYDLKDIKISSAGEIAKREYESNGEKKVVIIEIYVLVKNLKSTKRLNQKPEINKIIFCLG